MGMFVYPIPTLERFVLKVEEIICRRYYQWRDVRESVAGDPTEDIRVVIRGVSWIFGQNGDHGGVGGARGGHGSNTNPPTKTVRKLGAVDIPVVKEVGRHRWNDG